MKEHDHSTHAIAQAALVEIAKKLKIEFEKAEARLIEQDEQTTMLFWMLVTMATSDLPEELNQLEYCPRCEKFNLSHDPIDAKEQSYRKQMEEQGMFPTWKD